MSSETDISPSNKPPVATSAQNSLAPSAYFDDSPAPSFVIDINHTVTQWNKACEALTQVPADMMIHTRNQWQAFYGSQRPLLADLILSSVTLDQVDHHSHGKYKRSISIPNTYEGEDFFPQLGETGLWLFFSACPLYDATGQLVGAMQVMHDITQRKLTELNLHKLQSNLEQQVAQRTMQLIRANELLDEDIPQREMAEDELRRRNSELTDLNLKLSMAQEQLMQADKLASIGQLAAGVAHEINNPIGYVFSNFGTLEIYFQNLFKVLNAYEESEKNGWTPESVEKVRDIREQVELVFLKEDIPSLMSESKEGIIRVRKIVQDLKDFSRADDGQEWQWANLHRGIDSTLNIVNNEIKYKADLIREFGEVPDIECLPSQINQVIMNIVVNAAHAINGERGKIVIRTGTEGEKVWIEISDNGAGIAKDKLSRIFDPFYTTKPIGQGTGLGLSLSYGIIKKHQGSIDVHSQTGEGTTFRITLPIRHASINDKKDAQA